MDRRPLETRSKAWVPTVAMTFVRIGLKPNEISMLSIFISAAAGCSFLFAPRFPMLLVAAAAGIQLRLLCNLLDGVMAVEGGLKSKTGDLFNDVPDRIADVLILTGAGYGVGHPTLGWIASLLAVTAAYLRLLGGALGLPQDFCGPLAKQHRMFWMTVGALGGLVEALWFRHWPPRILLAALAWVAGGTALTCIRRTVRLFRAMESR